MGQNIFKWLILVCIYGLQTVGQSLWPCWPLAASPLLQFSLAEASVTPDIVLWLVVLPGEIASRTLAGDFHHGKLFAVTGEITGRLTRTGIGTVLLILCCKERKKGKRTLELINAVLSLCLFLFHIHNIPEAETANRGKAKHRTSCQIGPKQHILDNFFAIAAPLGLRCCHCGAPWLSAHRQKFWGSVPALWVFPRYSSFLPQSKNTH